MKQLRAARLIQRLPTPLVPPFSSPASNSNWLILPEGKVAYLATELDCEYYLPSNLHVTVTAQNFHRGPHRQNQTAVLIIIEGYVAYPWWDLFKTTPIITLLPYTEADFRERLALEVKAAIGCNGIVKVVELSIQCRDKDVARGWPRGAR
ncbi:MAG: hypothetical protein JW818_04595 [Pirellulales bacterium]|nr:hypothetical protein [Pirellulales bacterium]